MNTTSTTQRRFTDRHVEQWREEGFAIIPGFFREDEIAPLIADYDRLYGVRRPESGELVPGEELSIGQFKPEQFENIDTLPYDGSPELNLMSLHPALIEFAKALLGVDAVHLYQSHTWAKFTGQANYDQAFHCDFGNHTLTVPSDNVAERPVDFVFYLTDVTDAHGALHYVTKPDAYEVLHEGALGANTDEAQAALKARERSAAGPAGTLVAHSIDTFHRGTNLTAPNGYRYTMTCGYKASGNDMIGYHVWQVSGERNWIPVLANGTPEQLQCLGIPAPGHPYWTKRTLKITRARWPDWDMTPYFDAAGLAR